MIRSTSGIARRCAIAAVLSGTGMAGAAQAQDHMVIGLGALSAPEYEGSDQLATSAIPIIDISKGRFFLNLEDGLGVTAFETGDLKFGASVTYLPGFDRPFALGEVKGGAGARLFADWERGGLNATFGVTNVVSGDLDGMTADASLSYRFNVTPKLSLTPSVGATWADGGYNRSYFGITPAQAAAAGVASFAPGSGINDVSVGLTANFRVTERVTLTASATISQMQGDIIDSPIVFEKTQRDVFVGMTYRF